jgi:very-short-patch-repair endonuclease
MESIRSQLNINPTEQISNQKIQVAYNAPLTLNVIKPMSLNIIKEKLPKRMPSYERSFKSHHRSQFWSKRNQIQPEFVFKGTHKKYWFDCDKCAHQFEAILMNIVKGSWCPYCTNQKLCDDKECHDCFNKSLASTDLIQYWSENNVEHPRQIFKNSNKVFIFKCHCGHQYQSPPSRVIRSSSCTFCANKRLCDDLNCEPCYLKSFANNNRAKNWSKNNKISPRMAFMGSDEMYEFDCECGHTFITSLSSISNRQSWCPYCCSPPRKLCDNLKCIQCYEKSFASHEKAKYWSQLNNINPRFVFKSCGRKYIFICEDCNEQYETTLNHVNGNRWCSCKKNKTETIVHEFLKSQFPSLKIKRQMRVDWCRNDNNHYLPFDFYLEDIKLIIEVDGRQHFMQVSNWTAPDITQLNDIFKMDRANEHGYSVIRINQEDILYNKIDWKTKLTIFINDRQMNSSDQSFPMIQSSNILIGDIYDRFPIYRGIIIISISDIIIILQKKILSY